VICLNGENSEKLFLRRLEALAFCRSNDAVKLAFLGEEALPRIDELDLSALTELHRLSNGTVEMKFIDRIKLLELLAEFSLRSGETGAAELVTAIRCAADRLPAAPADGTADGHDPA